MDWERLALVGQIARPHGLRGQVVVNAETDFPDQRFVPGAELFVARGGEVRPLKIGTVRFHRGRPIIGFEGIESIDAAEALAGAELRVPLDRLAALPPDSFYRHDLIGCRVERRDGTLIGVVSDVDVNGGARLVVDAPNAQVLVPLAREICVVIDPAGKRIVIDPPAGLLELNARP